MKREEDRYLGYLVDPSFQVSLSHYLKITQLEKDTKDIFFHL